MNGTDKRNGSQADHGSCKFCGGSGKVTLTATTGATKVECPKCRGTGQAAKITPKG